MPELISAGTTLANSADITNLTGQSFTLYIKGANGVTSMPVGASYLVQYKTFNGD